MKKIGFIIVALVFGLFASGCHESDVIIGGDEEYKDIFGDDAYQTISADAQDLTIPYLNFSWVLLITTHSPEDVSQEALFNGTVTQISYPNFYGNNGYYIGQELVNLPEEMETPENLIKAGTTIVRASYNLDYKWIHVAFDKEQVAIHVDANDSNEQRYAYIVCGSIAGFEYHNYIAIAQAGVTNNN